MKIRLLIFICFLGITTVFAQSEEQKPYTLDECINAAIQNNPNLKSARLDAMSNDVYFKQSKNTLLPSINGSYNLGVANGRNIDPFTNAYVDERLTFSNAGLGLDATIFNGFRLINGWKQAKLNLEAAEMEIEAAKQTLILEVTLVYMQVLSEKDLETLAKSRIKTTQDQLARLKIFYDEETGNPAEYHDLQGQLAADKAGLAENNSSLKSAILSLNTLVNTDEEITAAPLSNELELMNYPYTADEVYTQALNVFPTIKSNELSLASAERGVSIARSQFTPEISLFAGLNTNFSSAARRYDNTGTSIVGTNDFVSVNNLDYQVLSNQATYSSLEIPYDNQFENNINSSFGIAVSIPILNGFRAKNNVTLQKIKQNEAQTVVEQTKLDLKEAIGQSYNAMQSAFERYQLLQDQVDAYRKSFQINEIRFNNGVSNTVDYLISKNNFDNAEINLSNIRYAYTLRAKVLEYYRVGL